MAKRSITTSLTFFEKLDNHLQKNQYIYFWIIFGITLITGLLLYDPRVSLTGDDSSYILRAEGFIKSLSFPDFQGPLYPMALSLVVLFTGISLLPLKLFSLAAMLAFMYITFIGFRKRIPLVLLFPVLLLTAVNSHVMYFATQTYSEAFYMFMQSLVFLVFLRHFTGQDQESLTWKADIKRHSLLALTVLGLVLSRSVGFSILIAIAGYFIFNRQWKNLGLSIGCFALIFLAFQVLKMIIWQDKSLFFGDQGSNLLLKDTYRPELGNEDLSGFLSRFTKNAVYYLSVSLFEILGFGKRQEGNLLSALSIIILGIVGLILSYKKNKSVFFSILVTGAFLITTFFVLQTFWMQNRLIVPIYAFILLSVFAAFYYLLSLDKAKKFQFLILIPIAVLLFTGLKDTGKAVGEARKLKDEFSGLTPDWKNYTMASRWIGENIDKNAVIACRKPTISTIYAKGRSFYAIYTVPTCNFDLFLDNWEKSGKNYAVYNFSDEATQKMYNYILPYYVGRARIGETQYFITTSPDSLVAMLPMKAISSVSEMRQIVKEKNNMVSFSLPDSLLASLKEANVSYVLTANIRLHPEVKNGETVNTVERYMYFIAEKYPYIFTVAHQQGRDDDEPAVVVKINWDALENK